MTSIRYIMDLLIIGVTLILELILDEVLSSFILLFLIWRIIRVIHGVVTTLEEHHHRYKEKIYEQVKEVEQEIRSGNMSKALELLNEVENSLVNESKMAELP